MSKPGAFALSKDAKDFMVSNFGVLRTQMKIVFPAVLLISVINQAGNALGHQWVEYVTLLPSMTLYAIFALSWHRTSLMGPDAAHAVHPANIGRGEWIFIVIFIALTVIPGLIMAGMCFCADYISGMFGKIPAVVSLIVLIALGIAMILFVIRLYFILPARSLGVALSIKEAIKVSHGLALPVLGATIVFLLIFSVAVVIYMGTITLVVATVAGEVSLDKSEAGILQFFLSIPVLTATFLFTAANITALSRAYKWGMENNPVT